MPQPMILQYRFISPIKTPCRRPHMSRPLLFIFSPHFSAWLINKCPYNFAQLVSHSSYRLNGGGKTYSILMHIRENSDTSSGGIDHSQSPLPNRVPMTSIIRPHSCWLYALQTSAAVISTHSYHYPLSSSNCFPLPFPVLPPSFALSPICLPRLPLHSHSLPFPPLLFLHISSLYSFPPVIRSWRPPADVNGGASQPGMSGWISSLRCSPASNEDGLCQNPNSCWARHRWGHNEARV